MKESIVITIRTVENIQLDKNDIGENVAAQVLKLLNDDDPELVGYEPAAIENYQVFGKEWLTEPEPGIECYTFISVTKEFAENYPLDDFKSYGAEIIDKVIGLFKNNRLKYHSIAIRKHELFDEIHLRFSGN